PGEVVDGLARPGEVDDHQDLVDDSDDVDRDGPPAEAEQPLAVLVGPLGGGGALLAAGAGEPVQQQRRGDAQVAEVQHGDAQAAQRGDHGGLPEVDDEDQGGADADDERGDDRRAGARRDLAEDAVERQRLLPGHRVHHPRTGGLAGQRADDDRDHDVDQDDAPGGGAEDRLDHVREANAGEVAVGEAGRRHQRGDQQQGPADAGHDERADDGPGRDAARRVGLLGQFARGVEADHDVGGHQPGGQKGPDVGRAGSGGRAGGVHHHRRAALGVREQRDHDGDDTEDLQDDAGAADDRHQPDPDDVDRGRDGQQDDAEQHRVPRAADGGGRGVPAQELEAGPDRRQDGLQRDGRRGHGENLPDDHDPAGEPAERLPGQPRRPLEDRARDREPGREGGEVQRHEHLADEHDRPRPEERRPAEAEAEEEQLEDGGEDGDVGEPRGEGREAADPAVQFLVVSEARQVGVLNWLFGGFRGGRHGCPWMASGPKYLSRDR